MVCHTTTTDFFIIKHRFLFELNNAINLHFKNLQNSIFVHQRNNIFSIIFFSGTTGSPKAVMCSQDNLTWCGGNYSKYFNLKPDHHTILSYLPLNHIAGQIADIYCTVTGRACIVFAEPDALKGSLAITLKEVQPTGFLTVPRLLERIYDKINSQIDTAGVAKNAILTWARNQALNYYGAIIDGRDLTQFEIYNYKLAKSLVLDNVKRSIGLYNIEHFGCASAPISKEILKFFLSIDCPIIDAFGLSESQSVATLGYMAKGGYREGSVGIPLPSVNIHIQEKSEVLKW